MSELEIGKSRMYYQSTGGSIKEIAADIESFHLFTVAVAPSVALAKHAVEKFGDTMRRATLAVDVQFSASAKRWFDACLDRQYRVTPGLRQQLKHKGRPGWKRGV